MKVISTENKPIKMWLEDIEDGALAQAKNLANLPFLFKHVALMPDSHQGYGMPIGGVIATKGVVIPNAVGVDIGCGMCACKTELTEIDSDTLKKVMHFIRQRIPVGFRHHRVKQSEGVMPRYQKISDGTPAKVVCGEVELGQEEYSEPAKGILYNISYSEMPIVAREYENARTQIGTLGGGNHFIEIQKGSDGYVWVMIHSGSRNLGKQVADHYNKTAIDLNKMWYSVVPKEQQLAFLTTDHPMAWQYMREMQYCVDFALASRQLMMNRVLESMSDAIGDAFDYDEQINIAHNYARLENHFGQNVIVHRKGATLARKDTIGIIPGSQGTASYIVQGLGNPESFESCSHGAGRTMGRKHAQRTLDLKEEIKKLDDQGIIHGIRTVKDLDEASGAYKNIDTVMENQKDLVSIQTELKPLAVVKG